MESNIKSSTEYSPKYQLNNKVIYNANVYYVFGVKCASASHPYTAVEYDLSRESNHASTTNKAVWANIPEGLLRPFTDELWEQIEEAKKILELVKT